MKTITIAAERVSLVRLCFIERAREYANTACLAATPAASRKTYAELAVYFRSLAEQLDKVRGSGHRETEAADTS